MAGQKITKLDAVNRIWKVVNKCYDDTKDLKRFSTQESDAFWEAMDEVEIIVSKHRGEVEARAAKPEQD